MTELTDEQRIIIQELDSARKTVKTDDYSMSIGELVNLYREGEIKLNPAFQRLFRWEDHQKTKLVESILIGIPIPEIFVAQKSDGTWHVVDGVQRLSTIFQLVGDLPSKPPLTLTSCKYLPSLDQKLWTDLPIEVQRKFKKSKIKVNIILTENSDEAQYELFQRLNTGGMSLSDQEVRNCLILMVNPDFFKALNELKTYDPFLKCLRLKDHNIEKEYHMELILRMYIGYQGLTDYTSYEPLGAMQLADFIDRETVYLINNTDIEQFSVIFKRTFDKLVGVLGDESFLKFDADRMSFSGAFSVSAFEMITSGIAKNIDLVEAVENDVLREKIKNIYSFSEVKQFLARGKKALVRFKGLTSYAKIYFS